MFFMFYQKQANFFVTLTLDFKKNFQGSAKKDEALSFQDISKGLKNDRKPKWNQSDTTIFDEYIHWSMEMKLLIVMKRERFCILKHLLYLFVSTIFDRLGYNCTWTIGWVW